METYRKMEEEKNFFQDFVGFFICTAPVFAVLSSFSEINSKMFLFFPGGFSSTPSSPAPFSFIHSGSTAFCRFLSERKITSWTYFGSCFLTFFFRFLFIFLPPTTHPTCPTAPFPVSFINSIFSAFFFFFPTDSI